MRFNGTLRSWDDDRGFGFLEADQGGEDIFIHVTSINERKGRPQPGQRFSVEIEIGPQGKKRAAAVRPELNLKPIVRQRDSRAQWGTASLFTIPLFAVLYAVVAALWRPPAVLALVYLSASAVTFLAYRGDKAAAKRKDQRTPEITLHLLALVGGWPGALLAQQLLRHKSVKGEFRSMFWRTVVLNITAFVLLCSPVGRVALVSLSRPFH